MISLTPTSNIPHKIRNTKLPRTKPLLPLFEVISNSIHAIGEAKKSKILNGGGRIKIKLIRNGSEEILRDLEDIDKYPIHSIEVIDNGIGLNDENLSFFIESDTDHKLDIGGKGVGRFVCLKAFKSLKIKSCFRNSDGTKIRQFEFKPTREAFYGYTETDATATDVTGTSVKLEDYKDEYKRYIPLNIIDIGREIIIHFQLYFIENNAPSIEIFNQNGIFLNLKTLFLTEFKDDVMKKEFDVGDYEFSLYLAKSYTAQSHKLHFCAHHRSVLSEGLTKRIVDLGKYSIKTEEKPFYYQAFVVGNFLDENVDLERIGFNFPTEDEIEEEEDVVVEISEELSLAKIRRVAIKSIEEMISDYLNKVRDEKMDKYTPTISDELPQYKNILHYRRNEVKKLPPNLSKNKLDLELYKIESDWKFEVKEMAIELIAQKKDITNIEEYKAKYDNFLSEFNEVGKSDLARYVIHRRAVIELLEKFIGKDTPDDKFTNEDIIHSIFFPIRSSSDEIPYDKQNLWLLDERLTYHSFLSSDRKFEEINKLAVKSNNRSDLLIFNDAIAFTDSKSQPFNSFTIVEFKRPQRDNYEDYDSKKNPLDQVETYIDDLLSGKITNRQNREIKIDKNTPFYVYIVCDITESFEEILHKREFSKTPDGAGYFTFKNKYYSAYIEVLPFEKVLTDARKRNNILFEKLGISH